MGGREQASEEDSRVRDEQRTRAQHDGPDGVEGIEEQVGEEIRHGVAESTSESRMKTVKRIKRRAPRSWSRLVVRVLVERASDGVEYAASLRTARGHARLSQSAFSGGVLRLDGLCLLLLLASDAALLLVLFCKIL